MIKHGPGRRFGGLCIIRTGSVCVRREQMRAPGTAQGHTNCRVSEPVRKYANESEDGAYRRLDE